MLVPLADAGPAGVSEQGVLFGHDLYRESIYASLARTQLVDLHRRVGEALVRQRGRGATVFPAELAAISPRPPRSAAQSRHLPGPVGPRPPRFAYADAAGHFARARRAVADAGLSLSDADLVDLLTAEAEARLRAGAAGALD